MKQKISLSNHFDNDHIPTTVCFQILYYSCILYNWRISTDVDSLCIRHQFSDWNTFCEYHLMHSNALPRKFTTLSVKRNPVKNDKLFCGDQYFSPTYNYTRLKLTPIKIFYQLFFLLKKNQITEILKKLSYLLCHILVEWRWVEKGS